MTVPAYREFGTSETISSTALAGAQGFSTSEVGSTGISKSNAPVGGYEKFVPGLVLGLTGLPLAAHHHSGHRGYHYGLLQRRRSGI